MCNVQETNRDLSNRAASDTGVKREVPVVELLDFKTKFAETRALAKVSLFFVT